MAASFDKAWQNILFNHFHDILPGSGVTETREYAMGMFQRSMAAVKINANRAMQTIAEQLNTSSIPFDDDRQSASEGGGAGYGSAESAHYVLTGASRGRGKTRAVTLFNTTMYPWRGAVTLTVWDWPGDSARVSVRCPDGTRLPVQVMETGTWYWDHRFMRLAVDADIPALGYATLIVEELPPAPVRFTPNAPDRLEDFSDASIVLENDCVRAEFDRRTMHGADRPPHAPFARPAGRLLLLPSDRRGYGQRHDVLARRRHHARNRSERNRTGSRRTRP